MEITENGALAIQLTAEELQSFGLRFEDMDYEKPATRQAIRRLLAKAKAQCGFAYAGGLIIEALPTDGGCLLLVTPAGPPVRMRQKRARGPFVYGFANVDDLFQAARAWRRIPGEQAQDWGSSLYAWGAEYRLVVYAVSVPHLLLLSECGQLIGEGEQPAAYTAEHGAPLAVGDAMPRLMRAVGRV